jgi:transcriptional regulator with XRE-family HTH domain
MPATESALKKFGANVRARRESRKLSQEALSEKADVDRTYVGGVERGERNLTFASALRIAKALNVSLAELCEGIDG